MSNQISNKLDIALKQVYKQGFNIYSLINKAKKQIDQPKEWQFPEEVLLRLCEAYKRDKANIKHPWPWFVRVLKAESAIWYAQRQIKANDKRGGFSAHIKEILGIK